MRLVLASAGFATLAAALFATVPASRAQDGNARWCAYINIGKGGIAEQCIFRTLEDCVPFVIAGNRGFCNENPRYPAEPAKRSRRHKAY